jgi:hypothetical protein
VLNVNIPTPYQKRQKNEEFDFDDVKRRRKTKDETASIERTEERRKLIFKTTCVSSQNKRMRKEEGATVAASHLPSLTAGCVRQAGPAAFSTEN